MEVSNGVNILAIDTSGLYLSAAVAKNDKIAAQYYSRIERSHSDILAPAVNKLLKKTKLRPKDIDLYAISIGPGSFTGLRIGVAFIKGMNLFFNKPVVCVPTLDAMASCVAGRADFICPIVDAKRQNVYTAIYNRENREQRTENRERGTENRVKRKTGYYVIPIVEILQKIKEIIKRDEKVVFVGDGIDVYKDEIIKALGKKAIFADRRFWNTSADVIANLGYRMYNENKGIVRDLCRLSPMYLYPKDIQCRKA